MFLCDISSPIVIYATDAAYIPRGLTGYFLNVNILSSRLDERFITANSPSGVKVHRYESLDFYLTYFPILFVCNRPSRCVMCSKTESRLMSRNCALHVNDEFSK
ncbi:hypothetical protein CEXT_486991 [Caerostris extrusa]|uniref:Uncharacterized protein n=1 Tax=Caerostris extrusa TaxID=172846 RepID=A0AAV4QL44_CAEEX|nr:hypothetical protein CEXT_486991 [Caerostris extrusa]